MKSIHCEKMYPSYFLPSYINSRYPNAVKLINVSVLNAFKAIQQYH
jgi:hypothetical protein